MLYSETVAIDFADLLCVHRCTSAGIPRCTEINSKLPNQFPDIPCKNFASKETFASHLSTAAVTERVPLQLKPAISRVFFVSVFFSHTGMHFRPSPAALHPEMSEPKHTLHS